METIYVNALLISLFATWFIPVTIRDAKTGEFRGFAHLRFFILLATLVALEAYLVVQNYQLSLEAALRTLLQVSLAIVGALFFVKYTNQQLFGRPIKFTKWW